MADSRVFRHSGFFSRCLLLAMVCLCYLPATSRASGSAAAGLQPAGNETGRYFALVIGIDKYPPQIPQLHTAVSDAHAIADVLEKQYGFQVALLTDGNATRARILDQLAAYQPQLTADDNLLIYYAGHGYRIEEANKSFWLPVDATSKLSSNRISADDLTTDLSTLKARHVLVISDSCYSGGLTRDLTTVPAFNPDEAFLRKTLSMRSRNLMASGRDEPVADGGPEGHSVFAWAVLQALTHQKDSLFTASALFYERVQRAVAGNSEQIPVYQPIRNSGDIGGDFVFRRVSASRTEVQAKLGAAAAGYARGAAYFSSGDYSRALPLFAEGCTRGDMHSCSKLGYMNDFGLGMKRDDAQAISHYRKSCDGGYSPGCSNLGIMYSKGRGVPKDYAQAIALYRKGCDGGDARGCSHLGTMYDAGSGITRDYAQAVALYRKACDDGDENGCSNLATAYADGTGVPKDYAQAIALYRKGCDGSGAISCSNLATMYIKGQGVTQDYGQAFALLRKGCDGSGEDDAHGCSNLAIMYAQGWGVTQDYGKAAALNRKACDWNEAGSCTDLATMYIQGWGVTQDDAQAVEFYRKGCDGGDARGCSSLGHMYESGSRVEKDFAKAVPLYRKSCVGGDSVGCSDLDRLLGKKHSE